MNRPTENLTWRGIVPEIVESRLEPVIEDEAILMWVRHGTLVIDVGGGGPLVVTAGEAAWLPPGLRHSAWLEPDGVALPIFVEPESLPGPLAQACVVRLPAAWENWLLRQVAGWFGLSPVARSDRLRLIALLMELCPAAPTPQLPPLPPLPRSAGALAVVERLRCDPGASTGLAELASAVMTSPRTLQRQLRDETGHGLVQWRTAIRIDAAAAHLAQGRGVGWTAHQVGYAGVTGFTHAFTARVGVSPGRYAARCTLTDPPGGPVLGARAPIGVCVAATEPPEIAAVRSASWVPPSDCVLWVQRGTTSVEIAGHRWDLEAGDVVWLPHGLPHRVDIGPDSILLPLGQKLGGRPVSPGSLHVVRMPDTPEMERFLLHTMVANHFLLRPTEHDEQAFLELLRPAAHLREAVPSHLGTVVFAVIDDPSDRRSLAEWAGELGADVAALRREFVDVMGESFPRWRAKVRMTQARTLMWDGLAPSVVARRLGYSHLPTFSKAFTASYGISPREWLRREAG